MRRRRPILLAALPFFVACGPAEEADVQDYDSTFLDAEAEAEDPKADTGFVSSLDAREVELTLEADVQVRSSYDLRRAPLEVGQFALTYLRERSKVYIQSLAEDYSNGETQITWKVGSSWKTWSSMSSSEQAAAKRFRLNKVTAVVLNASRQGLKVGKVFNATVPTDPVGLFGAVGRACEGGDGHIQADRDVYWYVWDPDKSGCSATKQTLTATVSTVLPKGSTVYPEYNKLYADKKLDVIVFFGQVGDNPSPSDYAFSAIRQFESTLKTAGFKATTATKGLRYARTKSGVTVTVDIYSPNEFAGLTDRAHAQNFFEGVNSHELIVFNGHSVLGASDFWSDSRIYQNPAKYQIFLYNGCLGYEYYVLPILAGKRDAANVDIVSNVIETPFRIMVQETATSIAQLTAGAPKGSVSWQTIMNKMNTIAGGDSFYGVSGARTNTYRPR